MRKDHKRTVYFPAEYLELFKEQDQILLQGIADSFGVNSQENASGVIVDEPAMSLNLKTMSETSQKAGQFKVTINRSASDRNINQCRQILGNLKKELEHHSKHHDHILSLKEATDFLTPHLDKIKKARDVKQEYSLDVPSPYNAKGTIRITTTSREEAERLQQLAGHGGLFADAAGEKPERVKRLNAREQRAADAQAVADAKEMHNPSENIRIGGKIVEGRTEGQKNLVSTLNLPGEHITLVQGPQGSGKTFLAVAKALADLDEGNIERIVLTRPAVEASGEDLGALPGGEGEKLAGYLVPLVSNIEALIGAEAYKKYVTQKKIEILPVGKARGRTYDNAVVIVDEAQNCADLELLTSRVGEGSHYIVVGDKNQTDLPAYKRKDNKANGFSGLFNYVSYLHDKAESGAELDFDEREIVDTHKVVELTKDDIVRSRLCRANFTAFERMRSFNEVSQAPTNDNIKPADAPQNQPAVPSIG